MFSARANDLSPTEGKHDLLNDRLNIRQRSGASAGSAFETTTCAMPSLHLACVSKCATAARVRERERERGGGSVLRLAYIIQGLSSKPSLVRAKQQPRRSRNLKAAPIDITKLASGRS